MRRARIPAGACGAALALAALLAAPATAGPAEDARALARVEAALGELRSARAGFTQRVTDAEGRIVQRGAGTLYLQKPGRFRWEYSDPAGQVVVADGRNLWLYDADLEQVTVRPAERALAASPAMLLAGGGKVAEAFVVSDGGREAGLDWVVLVPRVADGDFRRIRLGFEGGALRAMRLEDRLRQVTALDFSALERNPALPAATFRFVVPQGVDVVGTPAAP